MYVRKSSVHIVNSTITDNRLLGGLLTAIVDVFGTGLWLEGTEIRHNNADVLMRTRDNITGVIVADTPLEYITQIPEGIAGGPLLHTKAPLQPPPQFEFMTGTEQWFLSMVKVRICVRGLLVLCVIRIQ